MHVEDTLSHVVAAAAERIRSFVTTVVAVVVAAAVADAGASPA